MNKNSIVINTLVFLEDLKKGTEQSKLLEGINSIGINKVEIRREFIKNFSKEITEIRNRTEQFGMELFYSVPEYLYKEGKLDLISIEKYFIESEKMCCRHVKMNIGEGNKITEAEVKLINQLCDNYSVDLTIENDQTTENGKINKIIDFLDNCKKMGLNINATFDIGNWVWQNESVEENANRLKNYVTYIHIKDVTKVEGIRASLLDEGVINWRKILKIFNDDVPVALEYPCYPNTLEILEKEIKKLQDS